ncbi:hypothetical protein ACJ41O_011533 [Fusarium nematophilum]
MFTMPWSSTSAFSHPLANMRNVSDDTALANYISYSVVEWMTWQGLGDIINKWRKSIDLEEVAMFDGPILAQALKIPFTYCWSPALVPKPVDWPYIDVCGFFFRKAPDFTPPLDLESFLAAGPPPVYIGFGSIVLEDPDAVVKTILDAVNALGVRAIISKGWSKLSGSASENVYWIGDCPHEWLFRHVVAVVHHGGAGTTACGLRNGRPTAIVPFFGDQSFWGNMVAKSGARPIPIPHTELTTSTLTEAIRCCLSEKAQRAAAEIAARMQSEQGVQNAVRSFHGQLPLERLRCDILPGQPAVWAFNDSKRSMKLSKTAVEILLSDLSLKEKDFQLYESNPIHIESSRWDPISGGASAVVATTADLTGSITGIVTRPIEEYKAEHRRRDQRNEGLEQDKTLGESQVHQSSLIGKMATESLKSMGSFGPAAAKGMMVDVPLAITEGMRTMPSHYGGSVRDHGQVTDIRTGAAVGGKTFLWGMVDGVSDVVVQPYKGAREAGVVGAAKGCGRGIANLVTKSGAGMFGLLAYPSAGVAKSIRAAAHAKKVDGACTEAFVSAPLSDVEIVVRLPSDSKAARNDPKTDDNFETYQSTLADIEEAENNQDLESDGHASTLTGSGGIGDSLEESDRSSIDEFAEFSWLEAIEGFAIADGTRFASCEANLIRRSQIRDDFWDNMEKPTKATSELAFQLFDRYGRLEREFYEHTVKKGTGVWASELDRGDLLLLEHIRVHPERRRQKVATRLINAIIKRTRTKSRHFFAVAQPGHLSDDLHSIDESERKPALEASVQFFRSLGFRRVGTSDWFAFTDMASHPSKRLGLMDDWDEPQSSQSTTQPSKTLLTIFRMLAGRRASDEECVQHIRKTSFQGENDSWLLVDDAGKTILHVAALSGRPKTVQHIVDQRPELTSVRNGEGYTPLEALYKSMELRRTRGLKYKGLRTVVLADKFKGFPQSDIAVAAALTGTSVRDLSGLSEAEMEEAFSLAERRPPRACMAVLLRTLRLKYGCSCGQCIAGFLSPRMQLALLDQAEMLAELLEDAVDEGSSWIDLHEVELEYVPGRVRTNMRTNKSVRQGFIQLFKHFATCIRANRIPNEVNLFSTYQWSDEWPPATDAYLGRGGTVSAVCTIIFQHAIEDDPWAGLSGVGGIFGDDLSEMAEEMPEAMDGVAMCRNDKEFCFVAGMCGFEMYSG